MEKDTKRGIEGLEIGAMRASDAEEVLGVLTRGMRDNPLHVAAFGEDGRGVEVRTLVDHQGQVLVAIGLEAAVDAGGDEAGGGCDAHVRVPSR